MKKAKIYLAATALALCLGTAHGQVSLRAPALGPQMGLSPAPVMNQGTSLMPSTQEGGSLFSLPNLQSPAEAPVNPSHPLLEHPAPAVQANAPAVTVAPALAPLSLVTPQELAGPHPTNAAIARPADSLAAPVQNADVGVPARSELTQAAHQTSELSQGTLGLGALKSESGHPFDGSAAAASNNAPPSSYREPDWVEERKIKTAASLARPWSETARALQDEFERKGGDYLIDTNPNANYQTTDIGTQSRPLVVLTPNVINRAPWEFIQSVVARAQVWSTDWYSDIPPSTDKMAAALMNMLKVFVDLTNSTSRPEGWATDKDHRDLVDGQHIMWSWYEQLLLAARSGAHLIDTQLFAWARAFAARHLSNEALQFSLWEMHTGKYYRPGDPLHDQPIPAHIPRIDKATYDRASHKVYGPRGRGDGTDNTVYGWILNWLKQRGEIQESRNHPS